MSSIINSLGNLATKVPALHAGYRGFESHPEHHFKAHVAKLADAPDLGSGSARSVGSSPSVSTF